MKLTEEITGAELLLLGFEALTDDYIQDHGLEEEMIVSGGFIYNIGHSSRGQFYYLIAIQGELEIYATKPDGSGGSVKVPSILLKMFELGYIV